MHCGEVDRDERTSAQEWTVDANGVTDANGAPANRYYKLKWKGYPGETWVPSGYTKYDDLIREYFTRTGLNTTDDLQFKARPRQSLRTDARGATNRTRDHRI